MASFIIRDTFNLTNRGYAIVGDIMDNGKISIGDIASIQHNNETIKVKIIGVEMVDKLRLKIAHIGLVISFTDKEKIKGLNLNGMEIQTMRSE